MSKYFYFFSFVFIFACGDSTQSSNHNAALPHSDALPNSGLSDDDRKKMAQAKGKEVELVDIEDVEQMFDAAVDKLHIFSFWKMDCKVCQTELENLSTICSGLDPNQYRLVAINLDPKNQKARVNSYLREKNIHGLTYQLDLEEEENWFDGIHEDWTGEIPTLFFKNEKNGTDLMVNKVLAKDELNQLIQSML